MDDIPVGFAMSLAQDQKALDVFSQLDDERKRQIIERARTIRSKQEMRDYIANLEDYVFPQ